MRIWMVPVIVFFILLTGCNDSEEAIKGESDLKGVIQEVEVDENRILLVDGDAGLVWVTLPDHGKIDPYSKGNEVVVWIAGGINTSSPGQAKALNVEIVK